MTNFVLQVFDIDGRLIGEIPEGATSGFGIDIDDGRTDITPQQQRYILAHPAFRPTRSTPEKGHGS